MPDRPTITPALTIREFQVRGRSLRERTMVGRHLLDQVDRRHLPPGSDDVRPHPHINSPPSPGCSKRNSPPRRWHVRHDPPGGQPETAGRGMSIGAFTASWREDGPALRDADMAAARRSREIDPAFEAQGVFGGRDTCVSAG